MTPIVLICAALIMSDGDSGRCVTEDGERHRVRLVGIDAGEVAPFTRCRKQPAIWACTTGRAFGAAATDRARALATYGAVCEIEDTDRYRRLVATCTVAGEDIGGALVREGLAIADPTYGGRYIRLEDLARRQKKGVWQ